ncbi:hypothetical protein ABKA04_004529 [Annulohypoxylon sp. FPYF3050]
MQSIGAQDPTPSIVSVFLPSYGPTDWAALRGSIISSNDAETTYTIFCAPGGSHSCNIGGGTLLPFTFAEGPLTYHYEQTVDSTISITQACVLSNTTAATCSGSTSLGAITLGPLSGPSSTSVAPFTLADNSFRDALATAANTLIPIPPFYKTSQERSLSTLSSPPRLTYLPHLGPSLHWAALTLAAPPQTSTAGSLTLTYYSTGALGPPSTSEVTGSASATTSDPTAQLEGTSGGQRSSGTAFSAIFALSMVPILSFVLLW